jgi:hypothetical protein
MATRIELPQYEQIERVFAEVYKTVEKLPETLETRISRSRAVDHLDMAKKYVVEAREKAKQGTDDG